MKGPRIGGVALLVVDVQDAAVDRGPYRADLVLGNISELIAASRASGVEVIYVQHEDPEGPYTRGSTGWEIHAAVGPEPGEKVFPKRFNSAFRQTGLRSYLEEHGVGTLIVVGMQTEYCVDTTCRVAFENGFAVVVPEMTNTTFDNGEVTARQIYDLHNHRILDGRFAALHSMEQTLRAIGNGGDFGE